MPENPHLCIRRSAIALSKVTNSATILSLYFRRNLAIFYKPNISNMPK